MRIRSIKPEFWRSADIDALDWHQRLIFIGLWSYVDDNGAGDARVASIAADLFAHDLSVDPTETLRRVSLTLDELESRGMIIRYEAGSKCLLYITNWERHQLVKNPSKGSCYPLPPAQIIKSTQSLRRVYGESTETLGTGAGEQGSRGAEDLGSRGTDLSSSATPTTPRDPDQFDEFWSAYPRHSARRKAEQAYRSALKRADHATILDGAQRYRDDPNRDDAFTAMATTWLNGDRWNDPPLPPRRDGPRGQQQAPRIATADQRLTDGMALVARLAAEESQHRLELEA